MSATLTFRYDSPAVDGPRELRFGPGCAAGPNLISDDTTLGTLTDAVADALALLATNAAGTAARKVAITSIVRAILQATDAAGVRAAIGLGTLATQSGTFSGTHSGTSSGTNTGDQDLSGYALTSAVPGLAPVQSVAGRTGVVAVAAADVTDSTATGRAVLTAASQAAARSAIGAGTGSGDAITSSTPTNLTGVLVGNGSAVSARADVSPTAGSYTLASVTVDAFGRVTAVSSGSVAASALTGTTLASGVTASSLTSVGTLTGLTVSGGVTLSGFTANRVLYTTTGGAVGSDGEFTYTPGTQTLTVANIARSASYNLTIGNYAGSYGMQFQTFAVLFGTSGFTVGATTVTQPNTGLIAVAGGIRVGVYTVATLPSAASNAGAFAQVTDANSTTNGATVAGGGSNRVPVFSNGTNWIVK